MMGENNIRVLISGVCGRMGQETAKAVSAAEGMEIVGGCDLAHVGEFVCDVVPLVSERARIYGDLDEAVRLSLPEVMVDFTTPASVMNNLRTAIKNRVACVVGTTGITKDNLCELEKLSSEHGAAVLVAPNFAIGAVLMMKFASEAAKYMPAVEIIELHHDKKLDAPSGTAIKTAEMISSARGGIQSGGDLSNARGETHFGIQVHSVRLPGLVAHQEVIFGGQGQTLTIRHDSLDRTSFMPGVLMAIRKVRQLSGVVYGLENIL